MRNWVTAVAVFMALAVHAERAEACSATETKVYESPKSVWCVENALTAKYGAFPHAFFSYGDAVVDELSLTFAVPPEGVYTFEASVPTGGAHTGSECCGLGVTVTGDAFYNSGYGVKGYWGYLLSLHEMINDWTGQVTSGWPTDFWADHISAFPNSMDWHIMGTLGAKLSDANLSAASVAQKKRFYPGGDSADPRVVAFDQIFALPGYDYAGFNRVFGFVKHDKLSWDGLGVANPDAKRTEYVIAYLSLGARTPVTKILQAAHVGDGTVDGKGDAPYVVSDANIDAIASAHCALVAAAAQGVDVGSAASAFRSGNYAAVTVAGKCGAGCPAECGCKSSADRCVAPWLADAPSAPDAGDDGAVEDAATAPDAGSIADAAPSEDASAADAPNADAPTPDGAGGCSCRVAHDTSAGSVAWLVSFAAIVAVSRRSRAARR